MSRILEMAKSQVRRIINSGGFNQELTITPTGQSAVIVQGIGTRHSEGFDDDGLPIVSDNIHCTFSELDLNEAGATTRDGNGNLSLKGWKVSWSDAIGSANYVIEESNPDNTLGIIRNILGKRE